MNKNQLSLFDNNDLQTKNETILSFCYSTKNGHCVVTHGYKKHNGLNYICMWNPGAKKGKGGIISAEYSNLGTSFSYANQIYSWQDSVSFLE